METMNVGTISKTEITQYAKNDELSQAFATQLETGSPVVYFVGEVREGKDGQAYQQMYIAQMRDDVTTSSSEANKAQETFLGWGTTRLVRTIQNAKPALLEQKGIAAGSVLKGWNVQIEHNFTPAYDSQKPRQYPSTSALAGETITKDGNPVYEHATLVFGPANHSLITPDRIDSETGEIIDRD